jgi:hypothetical protein
VVSWIRSANKIQNDEGVKVKSEYRVAVMVTTQVVMDIEADNDLESIRKEAIRSYLSGGGNQEVGLAIPQSVVLYPMFYEGQKPPKGSSLNGPTEMEIEAGDYDPMYALPDSLRSLLT